MMLIQDGAIDKGKGICGIGLVARNTVRVVHHPGRPFGDSMVQISSRSCDSRAVYCNMKSGPMDR